ncbi:MAG: hypothetical protein IJJ22_01185, partial [Oscillospiraceae bacterium]|nr:hypothetical protein [Oscillospiraceae bacterium]
MTRSKRFVEVLFGIVMFIAGIAFFTSEVENSVLAMLGLIQFGMTVRGLRALHYYLTMAKYMVGGKNVLYRSLIWLDLGTMAGALIGHSIIYAVIYLAFLHTFDGIISVFRANESRSYGAHWKIKMAYGVTNILIAAAAVAGTAVFKQPLVMTYIYGAGLMYTAVLRIATA